MATEFEKGFRDIFLAGVGAMAITGEKAKEVLDTLIEKGGVTVEQGKDINRELQHKATETVAKVREESIAAAMKTMSAEERAELLQLLLSLPQSPLPRKPKRRLQRKRRNNPACSERGRVLLPRSFYIGAKPLVYLVYLVGSTFWGKFQRRLPLRLLASSL